MKAEFKIQIDYDFEHAARVREDLEKTAEAYERVLDLQRQLVRDTEVPGLLPMHVTPVPMEFRVTCEEAQSRAMSSEAWRRFVEAKENFVTIPGVDLGGEVDE